MAELSSEFARFAGRWGGSQSPRYKAVSMRDAPMRKTLAEAEQDEKEWRERES